MVDLLLDATAIKNFIACRERYRQLYIENRAPVTPSIHRAFGIAVHLAAEVHNKGGSYADGLRAACFSLACASLQSLAGASVHLQTKWRELAASLPDCVACYFDGVTVGEVLAVEQEWSHQFMPGVYLCGRKDKVQTDGLYDLKTASEIGKTWKTDFRGQMLRDFGLALYDWHECRLGRAPKKVVVECIVKGYRGSMPRLEFFELTELPLYRKRFEQQLAWIVAEIYHYHQNYLEQKPWPMAQGECHTKYGQCEFLPICLHGEIPKVMENYGPRVEHLVLKGA